MPIQIEIADEQGEIKLDHDQIKHAVQAVLEAEQFPSAMISIALVDDDRIRELHREFMDLDSPTDVLTFPLNDSNEPLEGEVVASATTAVREATRRSIEPAGELLLYLVHGVLHLCGYDDIDSDDATEMWQRQSQIMTKLGVEIGSRESPDEISP